MDLASELVVKVHNEVHVRLANGPPPSGPGLPPVLTLVPVLVQDGLERRGAVEDHCQDARGQSQEQAYSSGPQRAPHPAAGGTSLDSSAKQRGSSQNIVEHLDTSAHREGDQNPERVEAPFPKNAAVRAPRLRGHLRVTAGPLTVAPVCTHARLQGCARNLRQA